MTCRKPKKATTAGAFMMTTEQGKLASFTTMMTTTGVVTTTRNRTTAEICPIRIWDPIVSRKAGWVYAVSVVPELDLNRIKIGFTERAINVRLGSFRTANPTALLVGLWEAEKHGEQLAHSAVEGRIGSSEVFKCPDVFKALAAIKGVLR